MIKLSLILFLYAFSTGILLMWLRNFCILSYKKSLKSNFYILGLVITLLILIFCVYYVYPFYNNLNTAILYEESVLNQTKSFIIYLKQLIKDLKK
jgi:uncharacterized membrane protein